MQMPGLGAAHRFCQRQERIQIHTVLKVIRQRIQRGLNPVVIARDTLMAETGEHRGPKRIGAEQPVQI